MNACRHCGTENPAEGALCRQCGQVLAGGADFTPRPNPVADLTTPMPNYHLARRQVPIDVFTSKSGTPHRSLGLEELFAFKKTLVIGRTSTCDICLPHPSVSRRHALLERVPEGLRVRDLASVNGVLVGGKRISEPVLLRDQERLGIGPFLFSLAGGVVHALDSSQSLRLEAHNLHKVVDIGWGKQRKLLRNISLAVEPGEFVSLLGPSGSGKSTLMDCLNGRRPASAGQVLANGEDFYLHFDSFRQSLGYVPQRDIVHGPLPVYKALFYTARLRLPPDTNAAEIETRVADVMRLMELEPHQNTLVSELSGGQIKRVSLGAELLARPCLLYIDEATSGLDARTEGRMMELFRQLAHEGKSVLCITHNVDHVDLCDLIVLLAEGRLVFFGPPAEARAYFHADRVGSIYDRLGEKSPDTWEKEFAASSLHKEFVTNRLATAPSESTLMVAPLHLTQLSAPAAKPAPIPRHPVWHQFTILVVRYLELLCRDPRTLRLLILQAPLVALVVLLGFSNKPFQADILAARSLTLQEHALLADWIGRVRGVTSGSEKLETALPPLARNPGEERQIKELLARLPIAGFTVKDLLDRADTLLRLQVPLVPEKIITNPTYTYLLTCLLVITVLWFGCNNAAREIVKEEAIYARERAVNLGIIPYLASKFLVLSVISAGQALLTMVIVYGGLHLLHFLFGFDVPAPIYYLDYPAQFGILALLAMTGVALGLLLSASVTSPDRASTLLPYVLIPQIILGGGLLPVNTEPVHTLAMVAAPAYWAFRGVRTGEAELPAEFPWATNYDDSLWIVCAALLTQITVLLLLTAWGLRRKDVRKG